MKYVRSIGFPLFLIALGIDLSPHSWLAVAALLLGMILLAIDAPAAFAARKYRKGFQIALCTGSVVGILVWVFLPAPLAMSGESHLPAYPPNSVAGGIKWDDRFSEMTARIINESSDDYSNVVVLIETDLGFDDLRATQNFANCAIFPNFPPLGAPRVTSDWIDAQGQWHTTESVPSAEPPRGGWVYRITCEKLPHNTEIDVIGALFDQNFNVRLGQPLFLPRKAARWIRMIATYEFRRPRKVDQTACFSGDCADSLAPLSPFRNDPATIIERLKQEDASHRRTIATVIAICLGIGLLTVIAMRIKRWLAA